MADRLKVDPLVHIAYEGHSRATAYDAIKGKKTLADIVRLCLQK